MVFLPIQGVIPCIYRIYNQMFHWSFQQSLLIKSESAVHHRTVCCYIKRTWVFAVSARNWPRYFKTHHKHTVQEILLLICVAQWCFIRLCWTWIPPSCWGKVPRSPYLPLHDPLSIWETARRRYSAVLPLKMIHQFLPWKFLYILPIPPDLLLSLSLKHQLHIRLLFITTEVNRQTVIMS